MDKVSGEILKVSQLPLLNIKYLDLRMVKNSIDSSKNRNIK